MAGAVEGLERLELNLKGVEGAVTGPGLKKALAAAGFVAEGRAKTIASEKNIRDTGFLIGSIQAAPPVLTANGGEVDVGVAAEYAIHHEFGTSKMAARPFMRPAILEGKAPIQNAFSNVLKPEINNAIK